MRNVLFAVAALFFLNGCATIFSSTADDITFDSNPQGARIVIDGITVGRTPATIEVDRPGLEDTDVTVELEGYDPLRFELDKEFNNVAILNVLFWPGFVVDALTGALTRYDKKTYDIDLEEGTVSLHLDDLRRGSQGQYVLPDVDEPISVTDEETGLTLVFN